MYQEGARSNGAIGSVLSARRDRSVLRKKKLKCSKLHQVVKGSALS